MHRLVGKVSYVLAPIIIFSTLALARNKFLEREGHLPANENLANLFLPFHHMLLFAIFYTLAMVNKRPPQIHMRYIGFSSGNCKDQFQLEGYKKY